MGTNKRKRKKKRKERTENKKEKEGRKEERKRERERRSKTDRQRKGGKNFFIDILVKRNTPRTLSPCNDNEYNLNEILKYHSF